jgi:hypothetical protein
MIKTVRGRHSSSWRESIDLDRA